MLDSLLTSLLPYWASPLELDFHEEFVLAAYREYYDRLVGSGYRDRKVLCKIKEQTAYSMSMLFWRKPVVWWRIRWFRNKVMKLKRSVLPFAETHESLKMP